MEELALHILDLVQNCAEAGASMVEITIIEDFSSNLLLIEIRDNGRGMSPEVLANVEDPFFTTRTTRHVGLGIPLLKAAAEQAGGSFVITSSPGKGTTVRAEFEHDNIDRAPLGSVCDTVVALLAVHPRLDLVYTHSVNGTEFVLDGREIREICGEDLNHPKIIQWLKSYIAEQEKQLGGDQ
ncbi:MAG: Histidine kinase [Bacillota bacterium]|nr:MAG: Histidine kinase [Bacillota bacterium]MBS3949521.1 ATP-binding protein [Peptococcaceae bacterium]